MWPPDQDLIAAWQRLAADPAAPGPFAELVLRPLEADLARQFPGTDPHDVATAAGDAVLAVVRRPEAFDPAKGSLPGFLRMVARRDLSNLRKKEQRHTANKIPWAAVELDFPARNEEGAESIADSPQLRAAVEVLPAEDRVVYELLRDGERETAVFAAALGLGGSSPDEQAAAVKRAKDRVKARLKRAGGER